MDKKLINTEIYYYQNDYTKPITIYYFDIKLIDIYIEVYSSYWNNDIGYYKEKMK